MTRLLLAVANVAVLAYIVVVALCPRKPWRLVYALGWLWLVAATPAPSPQPTLPISMDSFCASKHAGEYVGMVSVPHNGGVVIMCERGDWLFTRGPTPRRIPRYSGAAPP